MDQQSLLPVSSLQSGCYGVRDICLSVPTVMGKGGVQKHVEIELWPKEKLGIQKSGKSLKETLAKVNV